MIESYRILYKGGQGEITEKKSRFIATARPVETEEEAVAFIEEMKKKYWDASHNCSAYVIGSRGRLQRCSDDGEPGQTAGRPMLDVLLGDGVRNICLVVTRYFGGTLLGTGGLVRAYTAAARAGLEASQIVEKRLAKKLRIETDYNGIGKLQYLAAQMGITILDTSYTDTVTVWLLVPQAQVSRCESQITETTSGRAVIVREADLYFGILDGEILLFDCNGEDET